VSGVAGLRGRGGDGSAFAADLTPLAPDASTSRELPTPSGEASVSLKAEDETAPFIATV
jgi:hypothetical protein